MNNHIESNKRTRVHFEEASSIFKKTLNNDQSREVQLEQGSCRISSYYINLFTMTNRYLNYSKHQSQKLDQYFKNKKIVINEMMKNQLKEDKNFFILVGSFFQTILAYIKCEMSNNVSHNCYGLVKLIHEKCALLGTALRIYVASKKSEFGRTVHTIREGDKKYLQEIFIFEEADFNNGALFYKRGKTNLQNLRNIQDNYRLYVDLNDETRRINLEKIDNFWAEFNALDVMNYEEEIFKDKSIKPIDNV